MNITEQFLLFITCWQSLHGAMLSKRTNYGERPNETRMRRLDEKGANEMSTELIVTHTDRTAQQLPQDQQQLPQDQQQLPQDQRQQRYGGVTTDNEMGTASRHISNNTPLFINSMSPNGMLTINVHSTRTSHAERRRTVLTHTVMSPLELLSEIVDKIDNSSILNFNFSRSNIRTNCSTYRKTRSHSLAFNEKCPMSDVLISSSGDEVYTRLGCLSVCNAVRQDNNSSCVAFIHRSIRPHCQLFSDQSNDLHGNCDRVRELGSQATLYELDCGPTVDDDTTETTTTSTTSTTTTSTTTTSTTATTTKEEESSTHRTSRNMSHNPNECNRYTIVSSKLLANCSNALIDVRNVSTDADCATECNHLRSSGDSCLAYVFSPEVDHNCLLYRNRSREIGGTCSRSADNLWTLHELAPGCIPTVTRKVLECAAVRMTRMSHQYSQLRDCGQPLDLGRGVTELQCSLLCLRSPICMTMIYQMEYSPSRCTGYRFNRYYDQEIDRGVEEHKPKCVYCHKRTESTPRRFQMRQKGCPSHIKDMQYRTLERSMRNNGTRLDPCD